MIYVFNDTTDAFVRPSHTEGWYCVQTPTAAAAVAVIRGLANGVPGFRPLADPRVLPFTPRNRRLTRPLYAAEPSDVFVHVTAFPETFCTDRFFRDQVDLCPEWAAHRPVVTWATHAELDWSLHDLITRDPTHRVTDLAAFAVQLELLAGFPRLG